MGAAYFLEVFLPEEADTLDGGGLAEGVFVHRVGIAFDAPLTVFGQEYFDIEVTEERLIGYIVIPIAHVAVDNQSIDRLELELRLVLLTAVRAITVRTDSYTEGQHIRQFGEPCIDLAGDGRGQERVG